MMKHRARWNAALVVCVTACGGNDATDLPIPSSGGSGGQHGGDTNPCGSASTPQEVAWDEQTALGTPQDAFAALAGSCTTSMSWNATADDNLVVSPSSGDTDLTVTVTVDESTAKFIPSAGGAAFCPMSLQVDAHVTLSSSDGTFAEDTTTTALLGGGSLGSLEFSVPADKLRGNLSIKPKSSNTDVELSFTVAPVGTGCVGTIRLETSAPLPGGHGGIGSSGPFASWSSTGCAADQQAVALDTPEPSIATAIATAWTNRKYAGTWDDGTATELTLSVSDLPKSGCKSNLPEGDVQFLAKVTYETSDGRLKPHSAGGTVHATGPAGTSYVLEMNTNEPFLCDAPSVSLPYTPADCGSLSRILLQLNVNDDPRVGSSNGGDVTVYEYGKNADPGLGAADASQKLSFAPAP